MSSLYSVLQKSKVAYNNRFIRKCLIICKYSTRESVRSRHKRYIYESVGSLTLKNVNNFFNLIRGVEKHLVLHEKDDIISECYLILDKCIEKFDLTEKDKKFYFYYNKSLIFGLMRIKKKQYNNKLNYQCVDFCDIESFDKRTQNEMQNHPLFLRNNFTDKEILLIQSKLEEEKIDNFCKKLGITKKEYYDTFNSIKKKINKKYL